MNEELIHVDGLHIARNAFQLQVSTLTVRPGEVLGLVGPNGAGKTTLLRVLAGMTPRDAGAVRVLGRDPAVDPVGVRLQTGFVSPDVPLFDLPVRELIHVVAGYYPRWDWNVHQELMKRFDLAPNQRASELSLGQSTRLRLLLALAARPRVLLLDEPATGLDLSARRTLMELVLEYVKDEETAVLLSSHRLGDVERLCERLVVLDRGRVVQSGPTDELVGDDRTLEEALQLWGAA